jgi:hypothetical protein
MNGTEHDVLALSTDATTRREVLRASLGGVALAASGLFLPQGLKEVAAREGAMGGLLGGRHGTNQRGRDPRRGHGKRKNSRPAPGGGGGKGFLDVAISVHNFRGVAVQVQAWQDRPDPRFDDPWYMKNAAWDWSTLSAWSGSGQEAQTDFAGTETNLAVRIGTDRVVVVAGGPGIPAGYIYAGGWDPRFGPEEPLPLAEDGRMAIEETFSAVGITLTRLANSPSYMRFLIELR